EADRHAHPHDGRRCAEAAGRGGARRRAGMKIAVVGGTGDFGLALAQRLAEAGDHVVVGSRDAERARAKAAEAGAAGGATNADAVRGVDLGALAGKSEAAIPSAVDLSAVTGA